MIFVSYDVTSLITNIIFQETIDIAMGSPFAPVLANIVINLHESKWLNEYNLNKRILYLRYVDDIFLLLTMNKIL